VCVCVCVCVCVFVCWQTLKRGKTAKIAKTVQDADEEEEEVAGQGFVGGGEGVSLPTALTSEASAIKSEALQEKQLQQQQRVSEVSRLLVVFVCRAPCGMLVLPHLSLAMVALGSIKRWYAPRGIKRWPGFRV